MLRNKIKKLIAGLLYFSGINFVYNKINPKRLILIGGHSIGDKEKNKPHYELYSDLSIDRGFLQEQIEYLLKNGYKFLNFEAINRILADKKEFPQKSVVMYFDDGFRDIYLNAYPIFKKYSLPFVVFVSTDLIDQKELPSGVHGKLKHLAEISSERVFSDWKELGLMSDLAEIGSHGKTHCDFVDLNEKDLKEELSQSIKRIQEEIGIRPIALSYPHGKYNERAKKIVQEAGFEFAITTKQGFADLKDRFELKKVIIHPTDNLMIFKLKLGIFYKLGI